ncbi:MAG: hypothetical protein OXM61_10330 [Candidatus Poribacteria bacterium]|nr:hypothetical protein [Candidatus Poribacteria bacterium]
MRFTMLFILCTVVVLTLFASMSASAELLFHDDFEKDTIDQEPKKWEIGFAGKTKAIVVADPKDAGNKVLKTSNNPSNDSRHDGPGGSIYVCGDADWDDYIAEWDMMFPDDFYMGVVFRFQDGEKFYLSDRRQGGKIYRFYKRKNGWPLIGDGSVDNKPQVWYRAQLTLDGDSFTFKLKERDDKTPFKNVDPATEAKDGDYKTGKFGNYGLVYIDNLFIGDSVEDLVLPVEPQDKLSTSWGSIKAAY